MEEEVIYEAELTIQVYKDKKGTQHVYLSHNGSSGCDYTIEGRGDLRIELIDYIDDILDEIY